MQPVSQYMVTKTRKELRQLETELVKARKKALSYRRGAYGHQEAVWKLSWSSRGDPRSAQVACFRSRREGARLVARAPCPPRLGTIEYVTESDGLGAELDGSGANARMTPQMRSAERFAIPQGVGFDGPKKWYRAVKAGKLWRAQVGTVEKSSMRWRTVGMPCMTKADAKLLAQRHAEKTD